MSADCPGYAHTASLQAYKPQGRGVLLKGAVADSSIPSGPNVLGHHHHHHKWHRWGPPHDSHDTHYWEPRHSAKEELMHCLKHAVEGFSLKDEKTWKVAGKAAARCLLHKLSSCHDV